MKFVKVRATFWKCYIQRRHHYILTALVFVIPIILFTFIVYIGGKIYDNIDKTKPTYNPKKTRSAILANFPLNIAETELLYCPSTTFIDDMMRTTQVNLGVPNDKIKSFASEKKLMSHFKITSSNITFAVVFKNVGNGIPDKLKYDIRHHKEDNNFYTGNLYQRFLGEFSPDSSSLNYWQSGFITLQLQIDSSYMTIKNQNLEVPVDLTLQEFPLPPYKFNLGGKTVRSQFSFITMTSFMLILPSTLLRILHEKESGIKELMKMMGLTPITMWFCWFIDALVPTLIPIIFIVFLLNTGFGAFEIYMEYIDGILLFLFFVLYCTASIALSFFLSTLVNQAKYGLILAVLIWEMTYIVAMNLGSFREMPWYQSMLLYLFPNSLMVYAYTSFDSLEGLGLGTQWSNLFASPPGTEEDIKIGVVFICFIIQTILFLLLTVYMDLVRPGKYGAGRSYAFPLRFFLKFKKIPNSVHPEDEPEEEMDYVKIEECWLPAGVQIINLKKRFGVTTALQKLSINFYKGEITILLGHNGAGKTTMMSILTGLLQPTSGKVLIGKHCLVDDVEKVRNIMGICPQHNTIFPDLNVWQHLKFFAMLKGIEEADSKINALLQMVKLHHKKNSLPKELSGGMQRKLCLGMAMISNPQILVLDEPTSGLDPKSRREIWDLLLNWQRSKSDTIVLISTHFMEEADALGDRVAVLDSGMLIAYGTQMFLKNEYDTGHKLTVVTKHESVGVKVHNIVFKFMSDAQLVSHNKNIRTYLLPNDKKHLYSGLIRKLENQRETLEIESITFRVTSLEDVFLKITKLVDKNVKDNATHYDITTYEYIHPKFGNVFKGLISHHFLTMLKTWPKYVVHFFIGVTLILMILILTKPSSEKTPTNDRPPLSLQLNGYGATDVFYGYPSSNAQVEQLLNNYKAIIKKQGSKAIISNSVSKDIIKRGKEGFIKYLKNPVVAAEFKQENARLTANALYSTSAIHSPPISLNLVNNAIAKTFIGDYAAIEIRNAPLPYSETKAGKESLGIFTAFVWAFMIIPGLLFILAAFVIIPLHERVSNLKQIICMTGVRSCVYWFQKMLCDLMLYLCILVVLIIIIICIQNPIYTGFNFLSTLFVMLLVFGITAIPFTYAFSYRSTVTSADLLMLFLCCTLVYFLIIPIVILQTFKPDYKKTLVFLQILFSCHPYFWLGYNIYSIVIKADIIYNWDSLNSADKILKCKLIPEPCCKAESEECSQFKSYWEGLLWPLNILLYLLLVTIFYFALLIFLDSLLFKKIKQLNFYWNKGPTHVDLEEGLPPDTIYLAAKLKKRYRKKTVVKDVSFNVQKGMCFGLLGVNGAGKTTVFKMLIGDTVPSFGTATIFREYLIENSLHRSKRDYLRFIGYCGQHDALNTALTCRELLTFFAKLRGIKGDVISKEVNNTITALGLQRYVNVKCGKYSGGNKRKLCLGLALIGNPIILLLDEPTTGVDPGARRQFWGLIKQIKDAKKQGIILTSHSMDECEELCDKLAIMKEGLVLCQDNVHNLKARYGTGYTVMIKIKKQLAVEVDQISNVEQIEEKFLTHFKNEGPILKNKHSVLLHFYVPDTIALSDLFDRMESFQKNNELVEDYTVAMASLEDIFLSFTVTENN